MALIVGQAEMVHTNAGFPAHTLVMSDLPINGHF